MAADAEIAEEAKAALVLLPLVLLVC